MSSEIRYHGRRAGLAHRNGDLAIRRGRLRLGINFFDTAAVYGNGRSEGIPVEALGGRRRAASIAAKAAPP